MSITVSSVASAKDLEAFIRLPWRIYRGDRNWVPPLLADERRELSARVPPSPGADSELLLARDDGQTAGRVAVMVDRALNATKGASVAYFSLFECTRRKAVAEALFGAAEGWCRARGTGTLKGPVSPRGPDGDEFKGLLVDAFDQSPVFLTSYNPPYYQALVEGLGFQKDFDVYAYRLDKDRLFERDPARVIAYAQRRYGFRLAPVDLDALDREITDIKRVLDLAVPAEWADMVAPSIEDVKAMALRLKSIADPEFVIIARAGDEPIGFGVAVPDYNQVLIHLNGRMTPLAYLKYLYYRRRMTRVRIFVLFVVPAFRNKGVAHAIYYQIFRDGVRKGYTQGEGSTIGEPNARMRADIESIGGQRYKTFRLFRKDLAPAS